MTTDQIKELRRLLGEATPGTWIDMGDTEPWPGTVVATDGIGVTPVCIDPEADDRPADRAWIAAIHNAASDLLTAAEDREALHRFLRMAAKPADELHPDDPEIPEAIDGVSSQTRALLTAYVGAWRRETDSAIREANTAQADLAVLRIEHALHVELLAAARREREEARAENKGAAPLLAAEINALPIRVRTYIRDIETRCDPTGDIQTIASLTEQRDGLLLVLADTRAELAAYREQVTIPDHDWQHTIVEGRPAVRCARCGLGCNTEPRPVGPCFLVPALAGIGS